MVRKRPPLLADVNAAACKPNAPLRNGFVLALVPGPEPQPACASCAAPSKPTAPTANIAVTDPIEFLMIFCSQVDCLEDSNLPTSPRHGGRGVVQRQYS
jgi:hypothetical protein